MSPRFGGFVFAAAGIADGMGDSEADASEPREKPAVRAADALGRRTRLDPGRIGLLLGSYLFVSKSRRILQMLSRLRS